MLTGSIQGGGTAGPAPRSEVHYTMQTPLALYIASVVGAVGLILCMPKRRGNLGKLGAVLAAAALGGLWLFIRQVSGPLGFPEGTGPFYFIFSAIAIGAAGRVITHTRPVYAALWFVMVILASAGLFLTLAAEFMALALIIIYAGAILVTYMFVIMLASQTTAEQAEATSPVYDRLAREPVAAVTAGFLLLALLLNVTVNPGQLESNPRARAPSDQQLAATVLADRPRHPAGEAARAGASGGNEQLTSAVEGGAVRLANIERIGVDLFRSHPLGLELAGVILLVALIGAVVIAKTRVAEEQPSHPSAATDVNPEAHPRV